MILAGVVAGEKVSGGGGGSAAFVAATAPTQDASFASAITTAPIDTTGANFLVAICNCYDGTGVTTLTDNKGNTWHTAALFPATPYEYPVHVFYAYNTALVGAGHTFTNTVSGGSGDGCPGMVVMAFSGMPTSDPLEASTGTPSNNSNGSAGQTVCTTAQTPATAADLSIVGVSGNQKVGDTLTLDSSFTIAGQDWSHITLGILGAYRLASGTSPLNPNIGGFSTGITQSGLVIFHG